MAKQEIRTFCGICHLSCAVVATVEDGKLVAVKPDKDTEFRHEICPGAKGPLTSIGVENHPDRLKYPLRRVGERGEGKWERISWDEALDTVASRLLDVKQKRGPEHLAVCLGEPKNMETIFGHRFATAFGTPNVVTPGGLCGIPRIEAFTATFGRPVIPDFPPGAMKEGSHVPKLFIAWGADLRRYGGRHQLKIAKENGVKTILIEPLKSWVVPQVDWWIKVRPGADGALAMGLLKVIIEEELYDKEFVSRWTVGFDEIRDEVGRVTLDDVERVTWVPKAQVQELARLYATTKPASIQEGNSLEFMYNSFDTFRVLAILRAITGNLNVPGGDVFVAPAPHKRPGSMMLLGEVGRDAERMLAKDFEASIKYAFTPYQAVVRANLEGKPYPINAAICCLTNPLVSYPDSEATYRAFMNMDLIVVLELFHTPTTAIADIVLPAAWTWEDDTIGYWAGRWEEYRAYPKVVDPPGEAWPDSKIFNELGKRVGLGKYFWDDEKQALDELLEGSGLSFQQFLQQRKLYPKREYKRPEEEPFRTPTKKVEICSERLKRENQNPVPTWEAVTRLPGGDVSDEYPLVLTSVKENAFMLTGFKMIESLRKLVPDPVVRLHPETARRFGLQGGEWIYIETPKGRITQKLVEDQDLDPRVVIAAFGWWFPEDGPETQYGWRKANFNILTSYEVMAPRLGSPDLKGIPCRVYRA